ncbi:hypothetical protein H5410_019625 [Solanum commersonii]|uniref:Endoglucanase n=1 Tax=Solanum commersonii TaxID=4109 RepID=A0A9J5Z8V0_SOLCO|nr:hypothetical protein H5410_019625 [Solanum commersonii]
MNNYLIRSRNDKIIGIMCWQFLMSSKAGHNAPVFEKYQQKAKNFMCSCLAKGDRNTQKTPGGLIYRQRWNNMYFVTSAAFLGTTYSDYLASSGKYLKCSSGSVSPNELLSFSKSQVKILTLIECYKPVDYILGDNPRATSYMVGYGNNNPRQVHHRASFIVSFKVNPSFVSCQAGYPTWYTRKASDPNLLTGALIGGPDAYDNFTDQRDNYEQTEPATYNNASLIGVLARLHAGHSGYNHLLPVLTCNGENPLNDTSSALNFTRQGILTLLNGSGRVIWSSDSTRHGKNQVAQLLDSGNLVVRDAAEDKPQNYLWQSFDNPGETTLPGMKVGINLKTSFHRSLSSWKSTNDPSIGEFTWTFDTGGFLQTFIMNGFIELYRAGPWNV